MKRTVSPPEIADPGAPPPLSRERGAEKLDTTENYHRMREQIRELYQNRAQFYDPLIWRYYVIGMRIDVWRRKAVNALALRPGDVVVDIGCGTGLNFPLLEQRIGEKGRIIGVDISDAMLDRARRRVRRGGWKNIELNCCAAADYRFPEGVGGILATGVLNYEPAYDQVIERGARALASGRRWVVVDYKMPDTWLRHLASVFAFLGSGFGVSMELMDHRPWESVQRYLRHTRMEDLYYGFVYLISGEAP